MKSYREGQWLGSPNYSLNRDGHAMGVTPSWVVIHTMVGNTAGANARFQDPSSQASAHYGVTLDGQLVQWVDEKDAAYHAGVYSVNLQSVGIEHEDGGQYNSPRPDALYARSARLVRGVCQRYGLPIVHGSVSLGKSGIIAHRETGYSTSCPDSLDVDRIIREAAQAPAPPLEDDEHMRVIFYATLPGGGNAAFLSTDATRFRHIRSPQELDNLQGQGGIFQTLTGKPAAVWSNGQPVGNVGAFGVPEDKHTADLLGLPFP